ncbi:hypothetical protein [Formosa algae]|uniref:Phage holin family protein n=1 Tax=Formosa algae TaxID=225843 RepID=A0A9X0YQ04_9FLAO|nr:hypothetical protein [Formosa algae]MBP1841604.1 hypothetical protein [Formosa algae]MDQ0337003.1 hypothetical protein [Formosa algae]OEI80229.1 hypothetical protein AST99_10605 [Formosa algae]PNW26546.1 hypothetical protein BKP44_16590 [Formosa algae]
MNVFESLNETSNKAKDIGERYVESSHQYLKLKIFQQLTGAMSLFGKMLLIGAMLFIAFLFLAMSAALAIGYLFNNFAIGTLIVGGSFLLIAFVIYLLRRRIDQKFIEVMSENFFD